MGDKPELRLALAMRGGVSLAVWIGGAVAEIDMVRRGSSHLVDEDSEAQSFWRRIVDASGYACVSVDVLAGASAGGLNGVLYAASQVYDFSYEGMRTIWLDVGDTEGLVRRELPYPSLFQGDGYFMTEVYDGLIDLMRDRNTANDGRRPRVNLELSATVLEPIVRPVPSPRDEPLVERRHASGFRFRNPAEPWLSSSFPAPDAGAWFDAALRKLSLAARATSSFPTAFEAANVVSGRRATFGAPADLPTGAGAVDLDGNFVDRTLASSFVVADGGVLDNIPIRRALDAAVRAPADGPTKRVLLYLQPGSTSSAAEAAATLVPGDDGHDQRTSTVAVLTGSLAARMSGENINADIEAIEAHNEAVLRAASVRAGGFAWIQNRADLLTLAEAAWPAYLPMRAGEDARRTVELLRDPVGVLGYDPFPRKVAWESVHEDRWRSPIAGWSAADREMLASELLARIAARLQDLPAASGGVLHAISDPGPLRRVALLLLEWARHLDGRSPAVGDIKLRLYRLHAFIDEALVGATEQAWVAAAARRDVAQAATYPRAALDSIVRLFDLPAGSADELVNAIARSQNPGLVKQAVGEAYRKIEEVVGQAIGDPVEDVTPPQPVLLERLAAELLAHARELARVPAPTEREDARPSPGALLDRALRGDGEVTMEHLAALEVLCYSEFVAGLPGRRDVTFERCSSENRTPLASHFERLHPVGEKIPVEHKLAGNELANFSAFLLDTWRANDWLWGRLDAVVSLVDLLVTPEALGAWLDTVGSDVPSKVAAFEAALRPAMGRAGEWTDDAAAEAAGVWSASVVAQVTAVADARAELRAGLEVGAVRNALIAQRQWAILRKERHDQLIAEERKAGRPAPPAPTLAETKAWVAGYAVGTETLQTAAHRSRLRGKVKDVTVAATRAIVWNLQRGRTESASPWFVTGALWRLGPRLGAFAARKATQPPAEEAPGAGARVRGVVGLLTKALPLLVWLALAVAAVVDRDGPYGAILAGVSLAVLALAVVAVVWLRWSARRITRRIDDDAARRLAERQRAS